MYLCLFLTLLTPNEWDKSVQIHVTDRNICDAVQHSAAYCKDGPQERDFTLGENPHTENFLFDTQFFLV